MWRHEIIKKLLFGEKSIWSGGTLKSYVYFNVFQIILAFGNYMNSSKRGAVYGFKLQSLDMVSIFVL